MFSVGDMFGEQEETAEAWASEETTETVEMDGGSVEVFELAFHPRNAQAVWPGNMAVSEFLRSKLPQLQGSKGILEIGAATGALSIFMQKHLGLTTVATSDGKTEGAEVEANISRNFEHNAAGAVPVHFQHDWGDAVAPRMCSDYDVIVGNDLLVYAASYPMLVSFLRDLLAPAEGEEGKASSVKTFVLGSHRRAVMKPGLDADGVGEPNFFEQIEAAGFRCEHQGKKVYTITFPATAVSPLSN